MTMQQLLLATRNVHKIREFRQILAHALPSLDIVSLLSFPSYLPPEEDGTTFEQNATTKAADAAVRLKTWALGDDSGLVVPALNDAPGIYSRRYAGDDATDTENRAKLLDALKGFEDIERSAYFECCLVLTSPAGDRKVVTGICEGHITHEERGRNGFGYDPLFIKNDYEKTFAQLDEQIKNRISHRRKAIDKLLTFIESKQM